MGKEGESPEDLAAGSQGAQLIAGRAIGIGRCTPLAREDLPPQLRRCRCPLTSHAVAEVQDCRSPQRGFQGQGQTGRNGLGPRRGPHPAAATAAQGAATLVPGGAQGWQAAAVEGRRSLRGWPPGETLHIGGRGLESYQFLLLEYLWGNVHKTPHLPNLARITLKGGYFNTNRDTPFS